MPDLGRPLSPIDSSRSHPVTRSPSPSEILFSLCVAQPAVALRDRSYAKASRAKAHPDCFGSGSMAAWGAERLPG